jgi:hypothetical protein
MIPSSMAVVAINEREMEMHTEIRELDVGELDQVSGGSGNYPAPEPQWLRDIQFKEFVRAMFASTKGAGPAPA